MPTSGEVAAMVQQLEDAMNSRQLHLIDDIMTEDFVRHCQATPEFDVRSREDFKDFLRSNTESFPDNVQTFRQVVVEGDRAGIWCTYEGTQDGPLGPFPASGNRATVDFGGVFHIRDGKFAEFWVTWDNMTILAQLGHLPAPEPAG
jgi:steroid delta-isomerase-like uncharacterized protein